MASDNRLARTFVKGECIVVREYDTIADAARRLAKDNIGAVPVCDNADRLTGMLTDRDIVVDVVAKDMDPTDTTVGEIARKATIAVNGDDPVERAMELMKKHQIRRVPVVEDGRCIGMLSQADIARAMPPDRTGDVVGAISED